MSQRSERLRVAVLASGRGSNLQAIIDACEAKTIDATVCLVVSDQPHATALERARRHHIPAVLRERSTSPTQHAFEAAIVEDLKKHRVELVCLAGYMRLVGNVLLHAYDNRIINIHPSLLPAFPGLKAQQQALEAGVKKTGCTIHFIDDKIDHGPIIRQVSVAVHADDTVESLSQRILREEHRLYPEVVGLIAQGTINIGRKK